MAHAPRDLIVLGVTGSIGCSTVDLVRRDPDSYRVVGMTANRRHAELATLAAEFGEAQVLLTDPAATIELRSHSPLLAKRILDPDATHDLLAAHPGAMVVNGLVGAAGLQPTLWALELGLDVALANKEALVVGGDLVLAAARESGAKIWPVDSEHSAIAQCLRGNPGHEVRRLWLTASGGPFRDRDPRTLDSVTLPEVLAHPTWDMGEKITVDSATMMNKGLEVIEAHFLFGVDYADIDVVIHRESIVHSLVEFVDGAFLAQMGAPDMRVPILYALSEGRHRPAEVAPWSPLEAPALHFEAPDPQRYPCLALARKAGEARGAAPIVLNAANEVAVAALLQGELSFAEIPCILEAALGRMPLNAVSCVEDAIARDGETRRATLDLIAAR